jgi:hypothetical protein
MNVSPEFKAMLAIKFDLCKKAGLLLYEILPTAWMIVGRQLPPVVSVASRVRSDLVTVHWRYVVPVWSA